MAEQAEIQSIDFIELAADLVAAYVSNNNMPVAELPTLISGVHAALSGLGNAGATEAPGPDKPTSAQIRKSITPDALISFLDGKPYKTLKRHLSGNGLTLEAYRERYGLPVDYPSTAASYSARRSELARSLGLGQQRRKAEPVAAAPAESVSDAPKNRDRPRNAEEMPVEAPKTRGRKKVSKTA